MEETDWSEQRSLYEYDALGRPTLYINRAGERELREYDAVGRLIRLTQPLGLKHHWQYDDEGNVLSYSDPLKRTTFYRYTAFKQLRQVINPSGGTMKLGHDGEGRLIRVENEIGEAYTLAYTSTGHVSQETDFSGRSIVYQYDLAGRCVSQKDPLQRTTFLEWSQSGQLLRKITPEGDEVSFQYDPLKRLLNARNQNCEVIFEWNPYGQLIKESQNGKSVESVFDTLGRRIKRRTNTGHSCGFSYDDNGLLTGVTLNEAPCVSLERDVVGREVRRRVSGGLLLQHSYDPLSRLMSQWVGMEGQGSVEKSPGTPRPMILERQYQFDPCSRLVGVTDSASRRSSFRYDDHDLVAEAHHGMGASEFFEYDANGKITHSRQRGLVDGSSSFGAAGGRRASEHRIYERGGRLRSTGSRRYEYDAAGQVVTRTELRGSLRRQWRYQWDSEGRLQSVVTPEGEQWRYAYDPFGRRIEKSGPSGRTCYVWDGDVIAEVLENDQEPTAWVFEPDSFRALVVQRGGETFHALNDHIGGLIKLFTGTGKQSWSAELSVWGETIDARDQGFNCPLRYQGQWLDSESGLLYMRHRYYDPEVNTFLSADPLGLWGGGQSYTFPLTPQNWIDPLGLAGPGYFDKQNFVVYGLYRKGESTPYYVGRTNADNYNATQSRHGNRDVNGKGPRLTGDSEMKAIHGNLSYDEARGLEQHYIEKYGTKSGDWDGNQANGIRPSRTDANAQRYREAAQAKLGCGG